MTEAELKLLIRDIPDFPEPGIVFKDITPLLIDGRAFVETVDQLAAPYVDANVTKVVGIEARGFIFGGPVANRLGAGFVPVRKAGKLPHNVHHQEYALEYGTDRVEIHSDAIEPGDRVLIIDDVLATGTGRATVDLIRHLGGDVTGFVVLVELDFLSGRARLGDVSVHSLVHYDGS